MSGKVFDWQHYYETYVNLEVTVNEKYIDGIQKMDPHTLNDYKGNVY